MIFNRDNKIAAHRRITENDNSVILRSLTTHNMKGLRLGPATEILASFTDDLKITHIGKYLKVLLKIALLLFSLFILWWRSISIWWWRQELQQEFLTFTSNLMVAGPFREPQGIFFQALITHQILNWNKLKFLTMAK